MRLTDRILLSCLKKQYQIKEQRTVKSLGWLKGPLLYEKGDIPENGRVYVAYEPKLLPDKERLWSGSLWLFVSGDQAPKACACAFFEESVRTGELLNSVRKIYEYYEDWEEDLKKIRMDQGKIDGLLQASLSVFGNPLMVLGADFSLYSLASSTPLPKEYRVFEQGKGRMDYINAFMQDAIFMAHKECAEPFWTPDYITGHKAVIQNIRREEHTTHHLAVMEYKNALGEECEDLLKILEGYVRYFLYNKVSGLYRRDETLPKIFQRILSDRTMDYMEASQNLSGLGWHGSHEYLCLVYKITYLDQRNISANAICSYMEDHFRHCCCFSYQDDIVTFFDLTLLGLDEDRVAGKLTHFIRDSFLKAGYSRVMKGHLNLRRQYVQACLALDVGSRKKPYMWIHHFNQIAMTYILEQVTRQLPGSMLCHEKLLVLKEMDERGSTEYMKTLKTYLDFHQNAVKSAKELYIHRSTFLYRLDKIKEILESDLEDTEEFLYLELSFRLLEQDSQKS